MSKKSVGYYEISAGIIKIVCDENYVLSVDFSDEKRENDKDSKVLDNALKQMDEYFKGKRKKFDLPLYFNGTDFQKSVWKALTEIPYGETVSYQDIARKINNEKSAKKAYQLATGFLPSRTFRTNITCFQQRHEDG